mgnify:CR=1 FL=1
MFSLQAEGLHGNHKDINAYHRTDYQYILIQFIYSSALRLKQLPISACHNTAPPLPDSSQHLQEVHTLYKILFPDAWNLLTLLRQRYLLINEPLQSVIH